MPDKPLPDIHPEAMADIETKIEYLREHDAAPITINRFLDGVDDIIRKIQLNPQTWSLAEGSTLTRKVQLLRFGMTAFYQIQDNGVPVILELCGPGQLPRWENRSRKTK
jgi:hypothetical protein